MILRYETKTRYYCAAIYKDLIGHWVVATAYGGKFNRLGQMHVQPVADLDEGKAVLAEIDKKRRQRRYSLVS